MHLIGEFADNAYAVGVKMCAAWTRRTDCEWGLAGRLHEHSYWVETGLAQYNDTFTIANY